MDEVAIKVDSVSKSFKLPHEKSGSIKNVFIGLFNKKRTYEKQEVLKDVSFEIKKGEFFGIVGRNGSGKSTLLKLMAGIYSPEKGAITVNGKLTPFIELGVGFNPELTGRENVYLNGALLGFNRKEMEAMYDEIVDFAELEKFMDQKLKNYSSGMQVRLAFSIAIRVESGVLILDEVLAVGDAAFQKKCYDYFKMLKKEKRTVVFVSHDVGALQEYCSEGILLQDGKISKKGTIDLVIKDYLKTLNNIEQKTENESKASRWGTEEVVLDSFKLMSTKKTSVYCENEQIKIEAVFKAKNKVDEPVFGLTISDLTGLMVFQSNTLWCKKKVKDMNKGDTATVSWSIPNVFNTGMYVLSPAVSDKTGSVVYDWCEDIKRFRVDKEQKSHGIVNVEHTLDYEYESKA